MVMVLSASGCASFLTYMSPVQSKVVVGEKSVGDFNTYEYHYKVRSNNKIILTKTPLCNETAQAYRESKKRIIGYSAAAFELIFYGLGIIDIVNAHGISENSKAIYPLAEYETGNVVACGVERPAANEGIIIENQQRKLYRKAYTDENGAVDLQAVLKDVNGVVKVNIRLESDSALAFSYLYAATKIARSETQNMNAYKIVSN